MIRSPPRPRASRSSSAESHETIQPSDDESPPPRPLVVPTMPNSSASSSASVSRLRIDPPLLDLEVDRGPAFRSWLIKWKGFFRLTNLGAEDNEHQVLVLQHCLSRSSLTVLSNLGVPDDPAQTTVDTMLATLKEYADQQINSTMAWHQLLSRTQAETESVDDYVIALRELIKECTTCSGLECSERAVCVQFVRGLRQPDITQELLKIPKLSLKEAIVTAKALEQAASGRERLHANDASVNRVSTYKAHQKRTNQSNTAAQNDSSNNRSDIKPCHYCGRRERHSKQDCPAAGTTCDACGKTGHYQRVCKSSRRKNSNPTVAQLQAQVQQLQQQHQQQLQPPAPSPNDHTIEYDSPYNVFAVRALQSKAAAPRVQLQCSVGESDPMNVVVLPDTGADITAVGPDFPPLKGQPLLPPSTHAGAANGLHMKALGSINITWTHGNIKITDNVHVFQGISVPLLSWHVAEKLHLVRYCFDRVNAVQAEPAEDTITQIKNHLITEFHDVFSDDIKAMEGDEFKINLVSDAVPTAVSTPRVVPFALREPLRQELLNLEQKGIIERVTEPSAWCSPIVLETRNNKVRICVDFTRLNDFVQREFYPTDPPHIQVADIAQTQARYFTKLDAVKGYHQCKLHEDSKHLTTFITPFGRFRYLRAPFGISSISDFYNRRMDECFSVDQDARTNTRRTVDDFLLYNMWFRQHYTHVRRLLFMARKHGVTLSKSKFEFARSSVKFAGYLLSSSGYQVDPSISEAIAEFPCPSTLTDLRSYFGLVNQLAGTRSDISALLNPLRPLLSARNAFTWTSDHQQAFERSRTALTSAPVMAFFELNRPTRLLTDASRIGLGFILQQQQDDGQWAPVQAGSWSLSSAETNYATIELELLGIAYAVKKCHPFIAHRDFHVLTDHKPIVPIINSKRMDDITNPRLLRLRLFLAGYQITAGHIPGKDNKAADALSRAPVGKPYPTSISAISTSFPMPDPFRQRMLQAVQGDREYDTIRHLVLNGFPMHRSQCPTVAADYWNHRFDLAIENHLLFINSRLVIPKALRSSVLQKLHLAHQGVSRTQALARTLYFWPRINHDIAHMIETCKKCQDMQPANPREPLCLEQATRPFHTIAADFFQVGKYHFLAVVDAYSNWPELFEFHAPPTSIVTTQALMEVFARFGTPLVLRTDNGPQFVSQHFKKFVEGLAILHRTSAPRYPQSNGRAEAAVKVLKKLVIKSWAPTQFGRQQLKEALQTLRNFPSAKDDTAPSVKVFGSLIRSSIPTLTQAANNEQVVIKQRQALTKQKEAYDMRSRPLPYLAPGSQVAILNERTKRFDTYAVVVQQDGRRYTVKLASGRLLQRDRRHIKKRHPLSLPSGLSATNAQPAPAPDTCDHQHVREPEIPPRTQTQQHSCEPETAPLPRRSTRVRRQPDRLIASM